MWSKTKKRLENLLCDSLKDRVDFHCSNYRIHDGMGRTYITVDGDETYNMCTLKRDYYRQPREGAYSQVEFGEAVNAYLNSPIERLIESEDALIRILVILDRRIGKRTLENMQNQIITAEDIVRYFYDLRCRAEGIRKF